MGRNEKCFCGSGKKRKKCHSDVIENSYIENLYEKYFEIENTVYKYRTKNKEFENHRCGKGCFNCCYDLFTVSMLEFELLLEEIRNNGEEFAEHIFHKALYHLDILEKDHPELYNRLEENDTMKDMTQTMMSDVNLYDRNHRLPLPGSGAKTTRQKNRVSITFKLLAYEANSNNL
ncbi:SEC-C metal-binding domain-containing protein [Priestia megaterium]|uniref:SEC-C metal-binding domain-containing protein n=1 Tax=Priestia megaterium TaxID=1404 RepID=UPI003879B976